MRGKVLEYTDASAKGVISGDDGGRYDFTRGDLQGGVRIVSPGAEVDFQAEGGDARSVYVVSQPAAAPANPPPGGKNKYVAALLALFLGLIGGHKWYLGLTGPAVILLLCGTVGWFLLAIPPLVAGIICIIECIIYLTKSDAEFYEQYVVRKKAWF